MRVRGLEGSSGLQVRGVERSSASSRVRGVEGYIALAGGARNPEACGTLLLQYILNYLC